MEQNYSLQYKEALGRVEVVVGQANWKENEAEVGSW